MTLDGRRLDPKDYVAKPMAKGARVVGGTILGRIGKTGSRLAPHVRFEIRPAGRRRAADRPEPILDGWTLLESTAIYRFKKRNPFFGSDAETPSIGQIMLMSKDALQRRAAQPAHRHLPVRPSRHRHRPDRPARARDARVPRLLRPQADRDVAALRPASTPPPATSPSTRPAAPSTSRRSTGSSSVRPRRARARSPTSTISAC